MAHHVDEAIRTPSGQVASRVRVLFIGGHSKSGSTLLDRMLGQLPGYFSTGELGYLTTHSIRQNRLCGCGRHFSDCPFWQEVGQRAFGGWDSRDASEFVALHERVVRHRNVPALLFPACAPGYRKDLTRYAQLVDELYQGIANTSGTDVVIDSTIDPVRAFVLRQVAGIDLVSIHLVRDSRGAAYSWTKGDVMRDSAELHVPREVQSPAKTAIRWVLYHLMFELLQVVTRQRFVVRYEDVVTAPLDTLRRISALVSPVTEDALGAVVTPAGVLLLPDHTAVGNDMRLEHGAVALRLDEAWRTKLPARQRRLVTATTWPLLRWYRVGRVRSVEGSA